MNQALLERLKQALKGRRLADIGQLQWINLNLVREQAGEEWVRIQKKIYDVAAHFIEKRLPKNDVMIRSRGGFIIVFGELDSAEATRKVTAISAELNKFLLGDEILRKLEIATQVRQVNAEELTTILARSEIAERKEEPPQAAPATQEEQSALRAAWKPDDKPKEEAAPAAEADEAMPFAEDNQRWDKIIFKPCWDAKNGVITSNFCVARRDWYGQVLYGRETLMGDTDPALHRELDTEVALVAQRGFQKQLKEGKRCAIVIPVHYDTVVQFSHRVAYFKILQVIPPPLRRFFYLRVDDIPEGVPIGQTEELFRSMKAFGSGVLAKLNYGVTRLSDFQNCRIDVFGYETPHRVNRDGFKADDEAKLKSLKTEAKRLNASLFLTQVETQQALLGATAAGVRYFSGPVIAEETEQPAPPSALDFASLHNNLLRRSA